MHIRVYPHSQYIKANLTEKWTLVYYEQVSEPRLSITDAVTLAVVVPNYVRHV